MSIQVSDIKEKVELETPVSLEEFKEILKKADWYFEFSDDSNEIYKGRLIMSCITILAHRYGGEYLAAFNACKEKAAA